MDDIPFCLKEKEVMVTTHREQYQLSSEQRMQGGR